MKSIVAFVVLLLLVCGTSCKKVDDTHTIRLIKAMKIDSNSCVINCLYDEQNRILSASQCDTIETYSYSNDTIYYERVQAGLLTYKYIYKLNTIGLVVAYTRVAADGSLSYFTDTYNTAAQKIEWKDNTHDSTYRIYTIANGNVITEFSKSIISSQGNYTINSIFYNGTENTLSNDNFGRRFLGKSSANLRKADSYDTPDGQFTISYTYELDYLNGVHKRVTSINGNITEVRYYEYY